MTMKSVDLPHLRSVVLAGHAGAGKTTLAEQLLFRAGAIPRLGRVDDGTAHLDFEPEEQKRRESLSLAVGTFEHDGTRITLVDTPGYPDFVAEVIEGFAAADGALFVMDASARRRGRASSRPSRWAGRPARAACFFINKCDRENADPTAALDALRATFGNKIAPLQLAIGAAESFNGYVDLVHRKAYQWDGPSEIEIPIPDELADEVATRRDQLLEAAAEADDDVLAKYLEGEEISRRGARGLPAQGRQGERPRPGPRRLGRQGDRSAQALLDAIIRYLPSPADEAPVKATDKARRDGRGPGRRERPAPRPRLQDHGRPVRRPADVPARAVRHAPLPGDTSGTRPATRTSASASCCCSTARSRSRSAS